MGFWRQLRLLLWKNFTLRRRQPVRIAIELIWPLVLFIILAWVRTRDLQELKKECHYDGKAMPSAGPLPFLQTFLCTAENTCHQTMTNDEMPGNIETFNASILSRFFVEFEQLLGDQSELGAVTDLLQDLDTLTKLQELASVGALDCEIRAGSLVANSTVLWNQIQSQNISLPRATFDDLQNAFLNLSQIIQDFLPGVLEDPTSNVLSEAQQDPIGTLQELIGQGSSGDGVIAALQRDVAGMLSSLPQDPTNIPAQLRNILCNTTSRPETLLTLPMQNMTQDAVDQLCALSVSDFQTLVQDFIQDLNQTSLLDQINTCAREELGMEFNINQERIESARILLQDFSELETLEGLISEINGTVQQVMNISQDLSVSNVSVISDFLSQLTCGRLRSLFQEPEDSNEFDPRKAGNDAGNPFSNNDDIIDYEYDNTTTAFCNDLFKSSQSSGAFRILWKQIKPMIRGYIPYTPDTPATRRIINRASGFFDQLHRFKELAMDWLEISPNLTEFLSSNQNIKTLRDLLSRVDNPNVAVLKRWLYNGPKIEGQYDWRDSINYTNTLMQEVSNYMDCFRFDKFKPYGTEEELVNASLAFIRNNTFWAGVVFEFSEEDDETLPSHVVYKIRMNTDRVDTTSRTKVTDRYWTPGSRDRPLPDMKYIVYGFAYIQDLLENAIVKEQTGMQEDVGTFLQQFPYPCYIYDRFVLAISRSMPLFMVLAWIYSVSMIVKGIVYEKEKRLKEVMKVMGLGNGVHWLAWFITSFTLMILSILCLITILKVGKVLEHSDTSVVFVFMMSFAVATIMFCFFLSVLFSRANVAAASAGIIYYCTYLPYTFCVRWEEYMTQPQKIAGSLLSNVAFGFGCSYMARYEEQGEGVQWNNIATSPIPDDEYSMLAAMLMFAVDSVIYATLTWYIEAVFPGQYGIPRPWYFFVTRAYWCGREPLKTGPGRAYEMDSNKNESGDFEKEPLHLPVGVSIRNLRKVYSNGNKIAVDGLNLNFYEGQITSFLGHNGAGKTTTMSILTGLFPPTDGTALIYGRDIHMDMEEIRQSMGMCPQHNVLFDGLTVEEHLWFYGQLKGMDKASLAQEIEQMIIDVGLPHKRHDVSANLSGGMKRKLSVGIAFVANSQVVILDEPTAGVDPYARRSIWELLLKYRKGRTIILSTHFMDEADILGDRIAIISQGKLCCCGSSLFLKGHYGNGYYLTLVKKDDQSSPEGATAVPNGSAITISSVKSMAGEDPDDEGVADMDNSSQSNKSDKSEGFYSLLTTDQNKQDPSSCIEADSASGRAARVADFITNIVKDAKMVEDIGTEITFQLPADEAHSGAFEQLFNSLDKNLDSLGISGYGISDTTLEEVFLRVAEETGVDELPTNVETERQRVEQLTDGGHFPRPVTRLSFRHRVRNFLGDKSVDRKHNVLVEENDDDALSMSSMQTGRDMTEQVKKCNGAGSRRITGLALMKRHIKALFIKRFHNVRRSKKGFVTEVVMPAVFICIAMIFSMINPPMPQEPPLELHPWHLTPKTGSEKFIYMFYSNDAPDEAWAQNMENQLMSPVGVGTRCMHPDVYSINKYPCESNSGVSKWTEVPKYNASAVQECSCDTGIQVCPGGAEGSGPPEMVLPTTDHLYNMTGRNISDWIKKTMYGYIKKRYGGLSFGERNSLVTANLTEMEAIIQRLLAAANGRSDPGVGVSIPPVLDDLDNIFATLATKRNNKVWFNNKGYVSMVSYMNIMNNLMLRANLPPGKDPSKFGITVYNHPLNRTDQQLEEYLLAAGVKDVLIAVSVIFALSFIPASFILFLVEERVSNAKHLQFVSGVNPTTYWLSNFMWDLLNYLVPTIICILIFLAFQQKAYVSAQNLPCLIALLLLYGWAVTPAMYPASFFFNVPSSALVGLSCLNVFLGIISTLSTFIIELLQEEDQELKDINEILMKVFLVLPHYCLGRGLIDMTRNQLMSDIFEALGEDYHRSPFEWDLVGRNIFFLIVEGFFFFLLNIAIQYNFWTHKICKKSGSFSDGATSLGSDDDIDVAKERQRVMSGQAKDDVLRIQELVKIYKESKDKKKGKRHPAVNGICVGVHPGECFGLLGVNGAGKTTTFKMLTGDTRVTSGDAYLAGYSVLSDMVSVQQHLGYCPQFDAIFPLLTGRENLEFYARLRGVPEEEVKTVAEWGISKLGLKQHSERSAGLYSGGNKRKLSTAIALVGNPPVIFLDEPTTGMDPKARRFLWDCITSIIKDGRSVILTSHSMEECEALCNRIAIMVNGTFKCLGSVQHLKNRHGEGYTVILRVSGQNPDMSPLMAFITETFPRAELIEHHHNMLQYQLGAAELHLSRIFGQLEMVRESFHIEDYSVSQTTLDQVFINFAKQQTDLLDDEVQALSQTSHSVVVHMRDTATEYHSLSDGAGWDQQSITGSTAGLLPGSARSSTRSTAPPTSNKDNLPQISQC